jgi:hypothetical protein
MEINEYICYHISIIANNLSFELIIPCRTSMNIHRMLTIIIVTVLNESWLYAYFCCTIDQTAHHDEEVEYLSLDHGSTQRKNLPF